MDAGLFDSLRAERLQWLPELGLGWFPVSGCPYDMAYWREYLDRDASPAGEVLTKARVQLVRRHWDGDVCDIGIGGGRFVHEHGAATGYDINPHAVHWLMASNLYRDPRHTPCHAATFWDSLEHIHDIGSILRKVRCWAFVSLPIFRDVDHVLASKHFKPREHVWYFTRSGFEKFMQRFDFTLREHSIGEQPLREDIESFAFERA